MPLPALVAVGVVAIGVSPIAFLGGPWFLMFLLPLALAWWVIRTRTVVDVDELRVVSALGSRRLPWSELATLRVVPRGWVRAVRGDDDELALTGVRARDLGRIAQASGGRITMPTPEEVEAAREHQRELEATRLRIARLREAQEQQEAQERSGETPDEGAEKRA
ncbi:PH (Pleckstrin Homology) domain-containing protein [Actinomycetospora cinnamomea]|uniref:PH (Pleckstrin Homology) domain-containing protein n=1 Tax=Actinomycetospora cinnamomea TaxID=663609 RepID=A0A2U1FR34_9PSEU|nr:PH (Pleckstrin Homology) domain-containing protein [Actinomycetospora cinnamomea]